MNLNNKKPKHAAKNSGRAYKNNKNIKKSSKKNYNYNDDEDFVPKAFQKDKAAAKSQGKKNKKHSKFKKFILIVVVVAIVVVGIFLGISANTWKNLAEDMLTNENSIVLDTDGNEIAKIGSERKNEKISWEDIPDNLKNAYIAIEDERFYKHHGVDIKRTAAAIFNYVIHFGSSSYGGSTITQQLVKNLTGDSTDSITRKVKEWWKASVLETALSKDEILEGYLNLIYVGPNMYGVETGAEYYFSKSAKDLTLEECAFLAGINNSPNSYNPFDGKDNSEKINNRTKTVLGKMLELGYINQSDYDAASTAVDNGLNFKEGEIPSTDAVYSYHTDALITEVENDLAEKYNISKTFATNYLNLAGLTISSTQDSDAQATTEAEFEKSKYSLPSKNGGNSSQAAMVIIDQKTGYVVSCVGGLGEKTTARSLNRATQSVRQTGSSIKPLAVLAPAIDKKLITASSIFDDTEQDFADGYHPTDYNKPLGKITVRRAVESSQNIPFVEIMQQLKPENSIKYLEKMGITTLTEEDNTLVLALGGLQKGISPLEMAGAYATIANDGVYIEPVFYSKIQDKEGKIIYEPKQETHRVFSKDVAYILKSLLTQPVVGSNGTATYCKISGVDVAAKTGTTDENYDRWLCGFTPYYTAVTWYGYDQNETIEYNNRNPAGLLWANVMSRVHAGLQSAKFEKPNTVSSRDVCSETGMLARSGCPNTYTEYFLPSTIPDLCNEHTGDAINSNNTNENSGLNDKVHEIIQGITNDIDAEDPQEKNRENENVSNITTTPENSSPSNSTQDEEEENYNDDDNGYSNQIENENRNTNANTNTNINTNTNTNTSTSTNTSTNTTNTNTNTNTNTSATSSNRNQTSSNEI